MNSLGDLRQKFDNALNPPPKQMTPTEGYQAYQSLLNDARTQKISLTGDALKAYYTSIVSDLVKYYNLAIQLGGNVNTRLILLSLRIESVRKDCKSFSWSDISAIIFFIKSLFGLFCDI